MREFLSHVGVVRNVHCRSDLAYERFLARGHDDALNARVAGNLSLVSEPLDLGVPVLEVDTTDGYDPALAEVIAWVAGHPAR